MSFFVVVISFRVSQSVGLSLPALLPVRDSHKSPGFVTCLWTTTGAAAYKLQIYFFLGGTSDRGFLQKIYLCPIFL